MRKVVKLTESDLEQIVKRVVSEQGNMFGTGGLGIENPFMSNKSYAKPSKPENINPKGLKLGDGGKKHPDQIEDVKKLQKILMVKGYLVTDSMVPTGYFGSLTNNALKAFYSKAEPTNKKGKGLAAGAVGGTALSKKTEPEKPKPTTNFKDLKVSNQVKAQLNYMKSNNLLSGDKFTILDDKNSQVHAFEPGYKLYHTYYVITGKNRGDQLKTQTMGDWVKEHWKDVFSKLWSTMSLQDAATYADNCYFGQNEWEMKNTPSGVFKRAGTVENFLGDFVATTFMEKDYGKRFITWETCDGKTIPFGFHGTKNPQRMPVLNDKNIEKQSCKKRKMSFGCINFNDKDVQEINSFISSGQLTIWLPDTTNDIVEIPANCISGSLSKPISRLDQYRMDNKFYMDPGKI